MLGLFRRECARQIPDVTPVRPGPGRIATIAEEGIGGGQGQGECANATWLDRTPCSQFTPRRWASAFRWSAKPTAR